MSTPVVCFLKGTRIWTPGGETAVEDLRIGDAVIASDGAAKPIRWIWSHRFERPHGGWTDKLRPIRVAPSALGPNTPHRELRLSQAHCLYLDGVLIPVADLVNGTTIARCDAGQRDSIEYFHIKLDRHDVIFADGTACETLRAVTADNSEAVEYEAYRTLYGETLLPDEPVAPILSYRGGRARLHGRIRSAMAGIVDLRSPLDIVRDNLERRAAELSRSER